MRVVQGPGRFFITFIAFIVFVAIVAFHAQGAEVDEKPNSYELGIHGGPLLPNRVAGVTEILSMVGVRAAAPTDKGMFELDFITGRGLGVVYHSASFDYRLDIVNDYRPVFFLLGGHVDSFEPLERSQRIAFGWHYGGGITEKIAGPIHFRADFRHRFGPGSELYIGVGILYRFPSSASSSNSGN